ncbi:MAG: DUF1634 domain-containing protein [Gammaproteobacteria bacterium]|nr:DUF1634 domain-containing protein [Gammaproteobacteria bacterium]
MNQLVRERRLLNTWILRTSIGACLLLIMVGLAMFFLHGVRLPEPPRGSLWEILRQAIRRGVRLHSDAFLDVAIVVLLLTPMARLLAGVYVSARARDWLYAGIGLLVLALVVSGVIAGQFGI